MVILNLENGWLTGDGGTRDISSLVIMTLTVASRAVRALYRVWAVRLHWGRHEITCRGIFMLMFCVHIFPPVFWLFIFTVAGQKSTLGRIIIKRTKTFLGKNVLQSHKSACRKPNIRKFMNGINLQHIYQQLFIYTAFRNSSKDPISSHNKCSLSGGRRCSSVAAARTMFSSGETSCSSPPISAGMQIVNPTPPIPINPIPPGGIVASTDRPPRWLTRAPGGSLCPQAPPPTGEAQARRWVTVQGEINFVAL